MGGSEMKGTEISSCFYEAPMLLVAVCDRSKAKRIMGLFRGRGALFNLAMLGRGTAGSKILNYLGIGESEKTVLLSALPAAEAIKLIGDVDRRLDLKKPGHGIVFTLPLDGNTGGRTMNGEQTMNSEDCRYGLVVAMVNRGYTEELMDAARAANATGGTIVHAKEFGRRTEKFFKVTIQPEREIVFILAESDKKDAIIKSIAEKAGPETPVGAVTISLPVCDVEGLQPALPPE